MDVDKGGMFYRRRRSWRRRRRRKKRSSSSRVSSNTDRRSFQTSLTCDAFKLSAALVCDWTVRI